MYTMTLEEMIRINQNDNMKYNINYQWNIEKETYEKSMKDINIDKMNNDILNSSVIDWNILDNNTVEIGIDFYEGM